MFAIEYMIYRLFFNRDFNIFICICYLGKLHTLCLLKVNIAFIPKTPEIINVL